MSSSWTTAEEIESHENNVLSDEDKILFKECVKCIQTEALRSAYILIWIMCAESLRRKLRYAASYDGSAQKYLKGIEDLEQSYRSADGKILKSALAYGFITDITHTKLENIFKMRHIYTHPYESSPKIEEVSSAVRIVFDEVLSQPTQLQHGFIDRLTDNLLDPHFIDNSEMAVHDFASDTFLKVNPKLHAYLFKKYISKLEDLYDDPMMATQKTRAIWFLTALLRETGCKIFSPDEWLTIVQEQPNICSDLLVPFIDKEYRKGVGANTKDYIVSYIHSQAERHPLRIKHIETLYNDGLLSQPQEHKLKNLDFSIMTEADLALNPAYEKVIAQLKIYNWNIQNPALKFLSGHIHEIVHLTSEQQERLGRNVMQAADGSARQALLVINAILRSPQVVPEDFIYGLLSECFVNERHEFRIKLDGFKLVSSLFGDRPSAASRVVNSIRDSSVVKHTPSFTYDETLELIKDAELAEAVNRKRSKAESKTES